jgi:hypothetical protein
MILHLTERQSEAECLDVLRENVRNAVLGTKDLDLGDELRLD